MNIEEYSEGFRSFLSALKAKHHGKSWIDGLLEEYGRLFAIGKINCLSGENWAIYLELSVYLKLLIAEGAKEKSA